MNEESTQSSEEGTEASTEGALKGYNQLQTKYGDLPYPDLFQQIFGFDLKRHDDLFSFCSTSSESRGDVFAWLRQKDLVFSRDERCGFKFDTVALAGLGDLHNVQCQIEEIGAFARELRKNRGFFFFRERYPGKQNKIYDRTHVFWCPDRMVEALPMFSAERMHFCEDLSEPREQIWMRISDERLLESILKKRKEATGVLETQGQTCGPRITYHYKGQPGTRFRKSHSRFVIGCLNGPDIPDEKICQDFVDPHHTGPWQRLW